MSAWHVLLSSGALAAAAPTLGCARRGAPAPASEHGVAEAVLPAIPWPRLCGQSDPCRVIRVDTLLHVTDHPYLALDDSIALVLSAAPLREVRLAGRTVIASRLVDGDVPPPPDTAIVWMGLFRAPRLTANERHVIAQLFVHGTWPFWVHCRLHWTGDAWHVDGVWVDEM